MKYKYWDQDGEHIVSEDQIMQDWFPYWSERMKAIGREPTKERCIQDFIVIFWAEPYDPEPSDS